MPIYHNATKENIYYLEEHPDGSPAMLLLHGLGVNSSSWQLQLPDFSRAGYRLLAPDLPGFGQSRQMRFSSFPEIAADMASLLRSLQLDRVVALGISMGGMVGLQLTLDYPDLVEGLVLTNSMAKMGMGNPLLWPYLLWRYFLIQTRGLEDQAQVVANRLFPQPKDSLLRQATIEAIMEADLESYRLAMKAIAKFNVQNRLPEIRCPTLVITGENDTTIPARDQARMAKHIPNARQVVIKDAGHAVIVDQPAIFNRHVLDFLQSHPGTKNQSSQVNP